jgi:hypothetical protein
VTSSLGKTAVAAAVTGMLAASGSAQADVVNFSWSGAFTWLDLYGARIPNTGSDYQAGFYANGDGYGGSGYYAGAPYFPGNVGPAADCTSYAPACRTAHGWYGNRTPVSGTLSFDLATGAGVGTINPFFFLGDQPGGSPRFIAQFSGVSFQAVDTVGTLVGAMQMSWNGFGHSLSIVLDGSGLFTSLGAMLADGPTSTVSGVGALPATNNINFGTATISQYFPLGPAPIATKTLNASGCEGQELAFQVDIWAIFPTGNIFNCNLTQDDGIGGSPAVSVPFPNFNFNFDITTLHLESHVAPALIPAPPAVWLFGSGLLGLIGLARRKKTGQA